jgi:hypothetical protein
VLLSAYDGHLYPVDVYYHKTALGRNRYFFLNCIPASLCFCEKTRFITNLIGNRRQGNAAPDERSERCGQEGGNMYSGTKQALHIILWTALGLAGLYAALRWLLPWTLLF